MTDRRAPLATPLAGEQLGGPDSDFVIVEWSDSGDSGHEWIAPLHVHHADDEAWYVLEGTMRFRLGEETSEAGPGSAVLAAKGTPHSYGNARQGEPCRYLLVMTPRIRALVQALHEPGASDYAAIFRAHESELLGRCPARAVGGAKPATTDIPAGDGRIDLVFRG